MEAALAPVLAHLTQSLASARELLAPGMAHASECLLSAQASTAWHVGVLIAAAIGALSIGTLVLPWLWSFLYGSQDLKKKYQASWALVTGGSSGIGLSLCKQLAGQGLSIVMVAYPDELLAKSAAALAAEFPALQVRAVGADLSRDGYMPDLIAATADIPVQLVFNNAGYIVTGFFADTPLPKWIANLNCNATAALVITHHFVARLRSEGLKGAICFTSSPANIIPTPFSSLYGATKSLMTHFGSSLACEVFPDGIDVAVLHPSPTATRFYAGTHALPTLKLFESTATGPDRVAAVLLRSIGRVIIVDQGYYPFAFRLMLRVLELSTLTNLMARISGGISDFKFLKKETTDAAAAAAATSKSAAPAAVEGKERTSAGGKRSSSRRRAQ